MDDAYTYGQIAAANALSDVYAMGGRPVTAMNILCFPIDDRGPEEAAEIIAGGASKVQEAGAVLVGGHSVQDSEPKFGMSVTGLIDPEHVASNAGAKPGDLIVLTKPLGVGIIATAARADACNPVVYQSAVECMKSLNAPAGAVMALLGIGDNLPVHAATDITGFGVLGHLLNVARGSHVSLRLWGSSLPTIAGVDTLIEAGLLTGGSVANRDYSANSVAFASDVHTNYVELLADPQTSGGIAIVVAPDSVDRLRTELLAHGALVADVIGEVLEPGEVEIEVCN